MCGSTARIRALTLTLAGCACPCSTAACRGAVQTLQLGGLCNAFGNGVVLPFTLIYLHNVRGISLAVAGLVIATNAAVALVAGPLSGPLVDRIGGRLVLATALVLLAVGFAFYPFVHATLAGVRRRDRDRRRQRLLLAGAVDAARRPDAARPASHHLRDAAGGDEPRDRARGPRRRADRLDLPPDLVHGPLRARRGHVPRLPRDPLCLRPAPGPRQAGRRRAARPLRGRAPATAPSCA